MKATLGLLVIMALSLFSTAQIKVSADKKYLVKKDDKPFFWLGDTAWELFHRLSREEAKKYLQNRAKHKWHLSNLAAMLRTHLFSKIEMWRWLDEPFIKSKPPPDNMPLLKLL